MIELDEVQAELAKVRAELAEAVDALNEHTNQIGANFRATLAERDRLRSALAGAAEALLARRGWLQENTTSIGTRSQGLAEAAAIVRGLVESSALPAEDTEPEPKYAVSDRGFVHMESVHSAYGGSVRIYESSSVEPRIWLLATAPKNLNEPQGETVEAPMHLTLDSASTLASQIKYLVANHYQVRAASGVSGHTPTEPQHFPMGSPEPIDVKRVRSDVNGVVFERRHEVGGRSWLALPADGGDNGLYTWSELNHNQDTGFPLTEVLEAPRSAVSKGA